VEQGAGGHALICADLPRSGRTAGIARHLRLRALGLVRHSRLGDGIAHHYFFWLLALDSEPDLEAGLSMWELLGKIEPSVIAMNRLVGTYSRS
jgi:hypothetical protein